MTWEYKTLKLTTDAFTARKLDEEELDRRMNELGQQGWELVSAFDTNQGKGEFVVAVFKRAK